MPPDSEKLLEKMNEERLRKYLELLDKLCDRVESGALHWRLHKLAVVMLVCLARRRDVEMPAKYVRVFVGNLIHDDIAMRNWSVQMVGSILQLHKRAHPKVEIRDPIQWKKIWLKFWLEKQLEIPFRFWYMF